MHSVVLQSRSVIVLLMTVLLTLAPARLFAQEANEETPVAETLAKIDSPSANQGIAVDDKYLYAVDNYRITKHDKETGEALLQWDGVEEGPVIHLDSGVVVDGKLYAAHSNWPYWPMTSSVEVWDTETMEHIATHSFGIQLGSFTWLDRYAGYWWGTFANYNRIQRGMQEPYGYGYNTTMVKMDDTFQILEAWTYPADLLAKFEIMSNSGGSWGPDGYLYITGHDLPEVYVMALPDAGSVLKWVATVSLPDIEGQGIAWDRSSDEPVLYGILRPESQIIRMQLSIQPSAPAPAPVGVVHGPGEMVFD